ncbi:Plasmid maintenance system antidote protein [alpha proteobacterium BAL199]|jgi:antitoxin HigA-1|nr:Plasmid maintenance system antidote protein [alpha proteobacterium BAL199]
MIWNSSIDDERRNVTGHPGEALADELAARNVSVASLSQATRLTISQLIDIIHGYRPINTDTALRLAGFFGSSARFWLDRQAAYDRTVRRDV